MSNLDQSVTTSLTRSVAIVGPVPHEFEHLLTDEALEFVAALVRRVRPSIAAAFADQALLPAAPAEFTNTARELHRVDPTIDVDGLPVSAGLLDFGLFVYHNADRLTPRGSAPYFHLPRFGAPRDAELWTEAFVAAQDALGIRRGSIRARVQRA